MTTKIARLDTACDAHSATAGATNELNASYLPNRINAMQLMNEALARVRMLQAKRPASTNARPPARLVAMQAATRREHQAGALYR